MPNPWLRVPLADYEAHMSAPSVAQLDVLADLFGEALARCLPASLAILGIAGGNGCDRIDGGVTSRVVGIDINPRYLAAVQARFPDLRGLELHCADLSEQAVEIGPVDLVHAALIFEHAGTGRCLDTALSLMAPGGILAVVLQLPSQTGGAAVASRVPAMERLKDHFSFVDPDWFIEHLASRGLELTAECKRAVPAGKSFWMGAFRARKESQAKRRHAASA